MQRGNSEWWSGYEGRGGWTADEWQQWWDEQQQRSNSSGNDDGWTHVQPEMLDPSQWKGAQSKPDKGTKHKQDETEPDADDDASTTVPVSSSSVATPSASSAMPSQSDVADLDSIKKQEKKAAKKARRALKKKEPPGTARSVPHDQPQIRHGS